MENRFQRILLNSLLAFSFSIASLSVSAQSNEDGMRMPPVIEPELERREVKRPKINTDDFELSAFGGLISIEDFGSVSVYGGRFAHHITEDIFYELAYGMAQAEETSFEKLSGAAPLLTDDERDYTYYNISAAYNLLPGESFIGDSWAFNSTFYVIAGIGNTDFAGENYFTLNFGAGYRFLLKDWFAVRIDVRDHVFNTDLLGEEKAAHNLEFQAGLSFFF